MSEPLVSIIIPVYNRFDIIEATIKSIQNQSYKNWECLIIDDCSTDNTKAIISKYVISDNRFKYYLRPFTLCSGSNSCRNYGFELCNGEYVNWFDSDDIMNSDFIFKKVELVNENHYVDAVINRVRYSNYQLDRFRESKFPKVRDIEHLIYLYATDQIELQTSVFLWNKTFLKNQNLYNAEIQRYQDNDFHFRMLLLKPKFLILSDEIATIRGGRGHHSQISFDITKKKLYDIFQFRMMVFKKSSTISKIFYEHYFEVAYKKAVWSLFEILRNESSFIFRIKDVIKLNKELNALFFIREVKFKSKLKSLLYLTKLVFVR